MFLTEYFKNELPVYIIFHITPDNLVQQHFVVRKELLTLLRNLKLNKLLNYE